MVMGPLAVAEDRWIVGAEEGEVVGLVERLVLAADGVETGDERLDVAGDVPIASLVLVFLGVEVLLSARQGSVLTKFEAAVDAVDATERRGQHGADHEGWAASLLQVLR